MLLRCLGNAERFVGADALVIEIHAMVVGAVSGGVSKWVGSSEALDTTFGSFGASAIGGLAGTAAGSATSVALGGHLSATDFAISVGSRMTRTYR